MRLGRMGWEGIGLCIIGTVPYSLSGFFSVCLEGGQLPAEGRCAKRKGRGETGSPRPDAVRTEPLHHFFGVLAGLVAGLGAGVGDGCVVFGVCFGLADFCGLTLSGFVLI